MFLLGHAQWFTDANRSYDWSFATEPLSLLALAMALLGALAWRALARFLPRPELPFLRPLGRLGPWIPRLLGVHAGVSLLSRFSIKKHTGGGGIQLHNPKCSFFMFYFGYH